MLARFSVWAPTATRVELLLGGRRSLMAGDDRGRWEIQAEFEPGMDYSFSLDGGDPLPDPRSQHQPSGIDGPSRLLDHSSFEWSDHAWVPEPFERWVVYELHVGTFTPEGTFSAAIEKLDHLQALGINAIELMPVNTFSGSHGWGYDGVGLFAPHSAYGGPDDLKRLVDACHAREIAVILDVVYNHLGPAGNHLPRFGPYFTGVYSTPWGDAINFDGAGSDEVRSFFIDNATHWLVNYHFDALRIDAIHAILDRSATHILESVSESVQQLVERLGRPLYLIAESDLNDPRVISPRDKGGYELDAQWTDDFHHSLHAVLTGERAGYYMDFGPIGHLAKALGNGFVYEGRYSAFRERRHGKPHGMNMGTHFIVYSQDHDQVGNRARGERLCHLVTYEAARIAAALVLTSPFVPMLFMGEEWAASSPFLYFTSHTDQALGAAVSEGRRREFASFGWDPASVPDPQSGETFERSKLNWSETGAGEHADMLDWYRYLIRLRRTTPDLMDPDLSKVEISYSEDERWLTMRRGSVRVTVDFDAPSVTIET